MSATTDDRLTTREEGIEAGYVVKSATTIPSGVLVEVGTDGYAINAAGGAGSKFVGVSSKRATAAETIELWTEGVFHFVCSGLTIADVGKPLYVVDNQTVTLTPGNVLCGSLEYFASATDAPVKLIASPVLQSFATTLADHETRIAALE